ncbi:MAG: DUF222 domain-containing protein [Pseudonocardiales bacterium]
MITRVMAALPPVNADVRVAAESFLIGQAAVLDPVQLGRADRALCENTVLATALDPPAGSRPAADGQPDQCSAGQRRADALTDLAHIALAGGGLPESGGVRPTLVVTIDHEVLTGPLPGAGLPPDPAPGRRPGHPDDPPMDAGSAERARRRLRVPRM